jgi:hypothetical protein
VPLLLGLAGRVVPLALLGRRIAGPVAGVATAWVAALGPGLSTTLVNRGAGTEAEYTLLVVTATWLIVAPADRQGRARLWRASASGAAGGARLPHQTTPASGS